MKRFRFQRNRNGTTKAEVELLNSSPGIMGILSNSITGMGVVPKVKTRGRIGRVLRLKFPGGEDSIRWRDGESLGWFIK